MHIAIMHDNDGTARVHAADCRDVKREQQTRNIISVYFTDDETQRGAACDAWSDFLHEESMTEADALTYTEFLPCTRLGLREAVEANEPRAKVRPVHHDFAIDCMFFARKVAALDTEAPDYEATLRALINVARDMTKGHE